MDIAGAYTQLSYRVEDVHLMACSLPGDLVAFFTCGTFGWGAMPFAFHQITGAVVWELNEGKRYRLAGQCVMYVDDIAGVCFDDDLDTDRGKAKALVEGLLGVGSIADDKTEEDKKGCLDFIGYTEDLHNRRVGITRNNVCRALACTLAVGDGQAVDVKQMQRIASHASRYKRVCQLMAPFSHALYGACKQHPYDHVVFPLTQEQMAAVWMMRILLLLTVVSGLQYTRTFDSFSLRDLDPEWTIEYDASLDGIAIIWFQRQPDGSEVAMGCYAASLKDMGLSADGSGRMNTAEFIAGIRGLAGPWKCTKDLPTEIVKSIESILSANSLESPTAIILVGGISSLFQRVEDEGISTTNLMWFLSDRAERDNNVGHRAHDWKGPQQPRRGGEPSEDGKGAGREPGISAEPDATSGGAGDHSGDHRGTGKASG